MRIRLSKNRKPRFTAFWLMPEAQRKGVTDSLLLESGTEVISAMVDGYDFFCRTQGDVRLVWKGESYRNRNSFPDDLVAALRDHSFGYNPDAYTDMNNWYEMTIYDSESRCVYSDLVDIDLDSITEKEAKKLILSLLPTAKEFSQLTS